MRTVDGRRVGGWIRALPVVLGLCWAVGCSSREAEPTSSARPNFKGISLTLGAVGDPEILAGIAAQRGEWTASREGDLVIAEQTVAPSDPDQAAAFDVLVFPGWAMGDLIDRGLLEEIPNAVVLPPQKSTQGDKGHDDEDDEEGGYRYQDIAPAFREKAGKYGTDRYAMPIGGSALVLAYRRDVFENEGNIAAAKEAGIDLKPPATWEEFDAIAGFLQGRDWDGDGSPNYGLAAALGDDAEGVANATFLARAASLGWHRDQYSFLFDSDDMAPRIASPPFVEAMKGVAAWKSFGPPGAEPSDIAAARLAFSKGEAAMLIDRAEKAAEWSGGKLIGVAPLPGSNRVYEPLRKDWEESTSVNRPTYLPRGGGWLVGVRRGLDEAKRAAALDLVLYLTEADVANRVGAERTFPMLPARASQMGRGLPDPSSAPDVDPRLWSDAVSRSLLTDRALPGLRVPDADGYLADLSQGRIDAVNGGKAADEALGDVAAAWIERTQRLGVKRQLWHYRRSLNALATPPNPPKRGE